MLKELGAIVVLGFLVLSLAPAGAPLQLSYVYSDSMSPTLAVDDGFLLTPSDSIETGDIVTFWAPQRDTYVTHRVVGETADGFITQGDSNPTTDQEVGHSAVTHSDIIGEVVTFQGKPITIPGYGAIVRVPQGTSAPLLLGITVLILGWLVGTASRSSRPSRAVTRTGDVLIPILTVGVLSAVALILLGATVHQFTFVAVASDSAAQNTLTVGESTNTTVIINRSTSPLRRTVVTAENMQVTERVRNASVITLSARIPPPEATGRYVTSVSVRSYPSVLPLSVLQHLNRIHPVVPATLTTLIVMAPITFVSLLGFDGKTPIRRSGSRVTRRIKKVVS